MQVGFQLGNYGMGLDPVVLYRIAADMGSAIATRYQRRSLEEVIQAANNGVDLDCRRFDGGAVLASYNGEYIDHRGNVVRIPRGDKLPKGEGPTPYGTIIISLSAQMSRSQLSPIVARAILFATYGEDSVGPNETEQISVIEGTVSKYASTVLSADSIFNTKAHKKQAIEEELARRFPDMFWHALFFPTRALSEELDYALFLKKMITWTADDEIIYIRSLKLLGLALLLFEYGWRLDISVETKDGSTTRVKPLGEPTIGALGIVFSSAPTDRYPSRSYLENHTIRLKENKLPSYRTASAHAGNMNEVLSWAATGTPGYASAYRRGFDTVRDIFERDWSKGPLLRANGLIRVELTTNSTPYSDPGLSKADLNSCRHFMDPFIGNMPRVFMDTAIQAMATLHPRYNWEELLQESRANTSRDAPLSRMISECKGDASNLWNVTGIISGLVDSFARAVINVPDDCQVRFPTELNEVNWQNPIKSLIETGLSVSEVVKFCAVWYAGVNRPESRADILSGPSGDIFGYWSGEQGILPTPIFERTLYCDLSSDKERPLTLHNTPIIGMPTDDMGWIRPGVIETTNYRMTQANSLLKNVLDPACPIVVEYRPHFERDITTVVASVYIGGLYFGRMPLETSLRCDLWDVSSCPPEHVEDPSRMESSYLTIDLSSLEPGEMVVPQHPAGSQSPLRALLLPQTTKTSRFFSGALASSHRPVLQTGCLKCAIDTALANRRPFVIPQSTSIKTTTSLV